MVAVGDKVTLTEPFSKAYPSTYQVLSIKPDGTVVLDLPSHRDLEIVLQQDNQVTKVSGADFNPKFVNSPIIVTGKV